MQIKLLALDNHTWNHLTVQNEWTLASFKIITSKSIRSQIIYI